MDDRFDERLAGHIRRREKRTRQFSRFATSQRSDEQLAVIFGPRLQQKLFEKRFLFDVFGAKAGDQ